METCRRREKGDVYKGKMEKMTKLSLSISRDCHVGAIDYP